jgi:SAM-dependent methyltransferase
MASPATPTTPDPDAVAQTAQSFGAKWEHNPTLLFGRESAEASGILDWILGRNGLSDVSGLEAWLRPRRRILDAGCGNGRVTALLAGAASPGARVTGIDINPGVAASNLAGTTNVEIREADLTEDLNDLGSFDFIYCQEVLHHTSDPVKAFRNLARVLEPGGDIAIYVYRRKSPMREYADDFIRSRVADMGYEEAIEELRSLTELGESLSALQQKVVVPAVPLLGIEAGEYDVQRFIYHFFLKCFWNDALTFDENAAINFDWYHPILCSRHTPEEVRSWFISEGLVVTHEHVDPYGITIHGRRMESI